MGKMKLSVVHKFTVAGIVFGCMFPFLATIIEVFAYNLPLNLASFILAQRENPLLWIIDSAIPILGFLGYLVGHRQQKLILQAESLEDCINDRSKEILQRKLFYEAMVENSPIAIVTLDPHHRILSANPAFEEIFGFEEKKILGKNLDELISDHHTEQEAHTLTTDVLAGKTIRHTGKRRRADGSQVDVEILGKPILIDGELSGVLGLYRDITDEKEAREEIEASEARFRSLFQNSPVALRLEDLSHMQHRLQVIEQTFGQSPQKYFEANPEKITELLSLAKIISANQATLSLFQARSLEEFQNHIGIILSEESRDCAIDIIMGLISGQGSIEQELVYKTLNGKKKYIITRLTILPGHESDWSRVLFSSLDITDRKLAEERLSFISLHDMMTGLYNRVFFDDELARLDKSRIRPITIVVCDMDNLKQINDQFGHKAGDIALQNIANILQNCFREEDIVARIGGDEFSIILPLVGPELADRIISRINTCIQQKNAQCTAEEKLGLSTGYCTAGKDDSLLDAFKTADGAMYSQKVLKKNCPD
jgi:diguanylate cyclase (GGDEF)-like protein/PAS domain S-box-containing protein